MDVFDVHGRLIDDYSAFTSSLVQVRDERIVAHLRDEHHDKVRWPDPWLSLNPSFEPGGTVDGLVEQGLLHPGCARFFRAKADPDDPGSGRSRCTVTNGMRSRPRVPATATCSRRGRARARA